MNFTRQYTMGKANSLKNKESVHVDFMVNAIGENLTGQ